MYGEIFSLPKLLITWYGSDDLAALSPIERMEDELGDEQDRHHNIDGDLGLHEHDTGFRDRIEMSNQVSGAIRI
jgi:hypothetical protein